MWYFQHLLPLPLPELKGRFLPWLLRDSFNAWILWLVAASFCLRAWLAACSFLLSCAKFSTQLEQAISQVSGDVQLKMPDIPDLLERSNDSVAQEESLMVQLESCIDQWTPAITDLLELQGRQKPKGPGPLAEVDHWRAKAAALGTVYEQLNLPTVKKLLEIMSEFLPHQYEQFKAHHNELSKQYIEAKDNVKFLTTLERYSALEYSS